MTPLPYWKIAVHSAYDMLSLCKNAIANFVFPARFLEWGFLSDCAIPDHCLLSSFHKGENSSLN